jgi:hypothetical protein
MWLLHFTCITSQAIIIKQRTVEAVVEMLDAQDYPAAAPQAVAVCLLLELVAGHHAGNTAAVFAAGMLASLSQMDCRQCVAGAAP